MLVVASPVEGEARETEPPRPLWPRVIAVAVMALITGAVVTRFFIIGTSTPLGEVISPPPAVGALETAEAALDRDPNNPVLQARLASALVAQARASADPALYARAASFAERALTAAPDEPSVLSSAGLVALAQHRFEAALVLADRALAEAPLSVDPLGVRIDALVELGRYDEATEAALTMVDARPDAASFSRVSYLAELTGDPSGALASMQQAVAASESASAGDRAYVTALVGNLHLAQGRFGPARQQYERALEIDRFQLDATIGLARLDAATGNLEAASTRLASFTDRVPVLEAVALRSALLLRLGRDAEAAAQWKVVRAIGALQASEGGVSTDLEMAIVEAAHADSPGGAPTRAVDLARAGHAVRPTVFASDALAWALRHDGKAAEALDHARAATRLGTQDATLWWHLAAIEADLGDDGAAREHLTAAAEIGGPLHPLETAEATALAERLGVDADWS